MGKPSLIIGDNNWAVKDSSLLGYEISEGGRYYSHPAVVDRNCPASYVDRNGILQTGITTTYGSEEVTNGGFDTDTDWDVSGESTVNTGFGY